ncbi:MAG: 4-(cytidine 5'-diphospho)-2-C-methyl-D-erythritol kinase [candidate division NC10 bacterium]|nr:4-(cytidine 5'-diphospho)-2-C-methyl-D-erythritol kinase [candidate division NC10 bacterium]
MEEVSQVRVLSPAKINLFLEILGKRPDGYHEIRTLMQLVDLYDEIYMRRQEKGVELDVFGRSEEVPQGEENLVCRAARALLAEMGSPGGVAISLYKRVPVGAGLGGGSSNAAATLWGMNLLFGSSVAKSRLQELALALGSDVPFFLSSGCAVGGGRGEVLREVRIPSRPVVIVFPGFGISSGWAYGMGKWKLTKRGEWDSLKHFSGPSWEDLAFPSINELEEVVAEAYPFILDLKDALLQVGARVALMTGSGSSVYGIFDDRASATQAARYWRAHHYWVHEGKTLDFNPILTEQGRPPRPPYPEGEFPPGMEKG